MKTPFISLILTIFTLGILGCHSYVNVNKRPNLVVPVYSNSNSNIVDWVIVDQGYEVKYSKWGFNTEIESMSAELTTNKTVKFSIGGLHSTIATNNFQVKIDDLLKVFQLFREAGTNDVIVVEKNPFEGQERKNN